jgi:hypothetical protein
MIKVGDWSCSAAGEQKKKGALKKQSKPKTPLESTRAKNEPTMLLILGHLEDFSTIYMKTSGLRCFEMENESYRLGSRYVYENKIDAEH